MGHHNGYLSGVGLQREELDVTWSAVSAAQRAVILTHANPDADAVASLLAVADALSALGRQVDPAVGDGELPENLRFLPGSERLVDPTTIEVGPTDLLILVDCADPMRLGPTYYAHQEWFDGSRPIINIDHHVTNTRFGSINLVEPDAAATCEILAILFLELGVEIQADVATCLLAGLQGDTLGLRTPSTTSRTLRVAADLIERGADLDTIVDNLFRVKPFSTIKLWGLALTRAEQLGDLVWTEITPEMLRVSGATPAEGEGIVNFLAGSRGARAAALFYEQADGWRVSLRSIHDDVDVSALASLYGGGGHSRAAGCRLPPGVDVRDRFLADIAARVSEQAVSGRPPQP